MKRSSFIAAFAVTVLATASLLGPSTTQTNISQGLRHKLLTNGTSSNWAGYAVETNLTTPQNKAVSEVSGQWQVPSVTCPIGRNSNYYSSSWVGIDGYSDNTVEQTGTEQDCQRGQPTYYAWFEFYPQAESAINRMPVRPGDIMSGDVKFSGINSFTVTITDKATRQTYAVTRQLGGTSRQSAEWITEAPSSYYGVLPLANFGSMGFTQASATLNGHLGTVSDPAWQHDVISMLTSANGPAKATPSALSTDGSSFTVTWQHS